MSESKSCATCVHFSRNNADEGAGKEQGSCVRYPPMPMLMEHATILGKTAGMAGVSPPVHQDFCCGEHSVIAPALLQ